MALAFARAAATIGVAVLVWWGIVALARVPAFLLPPPNIVASKLVFLATRAELAHHIAVTVQEIALGFLIGGALGVGVAWLSFHVPVAGRVLSPVILLLQTAPKIAIAPLLILWLGLDMAPKVALIAIVSFFPIMAGGLAGFRGIEAPYRDLARVLKLTRWQVALRVELLFALPPMLAGARIAATQAVTAAVIGELMGATYGLGYLLSVGEENSDAGVVIATVLVLSALGWFAHEIVRIVERLVLPWHESRISVEAHA